MVYNNNFDPTKNYDAVRVNFGTKPLSSEINALQSILEDKLTKTTDSFFESGFILDDLIVLGSSASSLTLSAATIQMEGYPRRFEAQTLNISTAPSIVPIYGYIEFTEITDQIDPTLAHPLQPGLPVSSRSKANYSYQIVDPITLTLSTNRIKIQFVKIAEYSKVTGRLTKLVTNSSRFMNLNKIPGKLETGQIAPGSIDSNAIDIQIDGQSLKDALALRMSDSSGNFLASGGALVYLDNIISGSPQGVQIRLEAFRAYVQGYLVKSDRDIVYHLTHTNTTSTRQNEPKTYTTGTLTYNLTNSPVNALVSLDGDVTVTNQNVNRSASGNTDLLPFTPVSSITSITQVSAGPFVQGTDYTLVGDTVNWISGNRPLAGTTYQVTFVYRRAFTVSGAGADVTLGAGRKTLVFTGGSNPLPNNGSSFQVTYTYFLPRTDTLVVDRFGNLTILNGIPADFPKSPVIPEKTFVLGEFNLTAGSHLGNTFLAANGYPEMGPDNIKYRDIQVVASKMVDHQKRNDNLIQLAFNDASNTALNYLVTKDPSLTKKGSFADGLFDDRLSDYGSPSQNMVFNSELKQGEASRTKLLSLLAPTTYTVAGGKFHAGNKFFTLDYTETTLIDQQQWSGEVNLDPYVEAESVRRIEVVNTNLVRSQPLIIRGFNWNFGEDNIRFFLNNVQLTGITILSGSAGSISDSVTPSSTMSFEVSFLVPNNVPIGYRTIRAESQISGKYAEFLVGVQTASTPLPSIASAEAAVPDIANPPRNTPRCGELRYILGHDEQGRRINDEIRIIKRGNIGEVQRYDCGVNTWVFVSFWDPIAQTFVVGEDCYVTSVEVYFTSKDPTASVGGYILLTKDNGEPDLAAGRIGTCILPASQVNTNGTSTKFTFNQPVWCQAGSTYAFYLETALPSYRVQFAKIGGLDRSAYSLTPAGRVMFTSATGQPIGPGLEVALNASRFKNATHRFQTKSTTFTPTQALDVYALSAPVYVEQSATNLAATAIWELRNVTDGVMLYTTNRVLNPSNNQKRGNFCVAGKASDYPDVRPGDDSIPAPIRLLAGKTYSWTVRVDLASPQPWLRDDYPNDGILNGSVTTFTPATTTFQKVGKNPIPSGVLWRSPDGQAWVGSPDEDLRIKINIADFSANTSVTLPFKTFNTTPGAGELSIADSFTHFTSLLTAVQPTGTSVAMEYSLDGTTWSPNVPVVFKQREFNDRSDRESWSFFNFGFFSDLRFRQQQVDPQFVPANPNRAISAGVLSTRLFTRLKLSTTKSKLSPVVDASNWAVNFEKYGLSTTYVSRTSTLTAGPSSVRVYVWAILGGTVSQSVSLTLDGTNTGSPTYVTKTSPTSTRIIDSATNTIEYEYLFSSGDLASQTVVLNPKLIINHTTTNRFVQGILKRVAANYL